MIKEFRSMDAKERKVELSDGRIMPLDDMIKDYERLLNEVNSKKVITPEPNKEIPKDAVTSKSKDEKSVRPEVGKWFLVDRDVIDKNQEEIRRQCMEVGDSGKKLWEYFKKVERNSGKAPFIYPRVFETYIFELEQAEKEFSIRSLWRKRYEWTIDDYVRKCEELGDGICDEHTYTYELQMRICNGESVTDLIKKPDTTSYERRLIRYSSPFQRLFSLAGGCATFRCSATFFEDLGRLSFYGGFDSNSPGLIEACFFAPYIFRKVR